jgi:hypothetical protein
LLNKDDVQAALKRAEFYDFGAAASDTSSTRDRARPAPGPIY